MRIFEEKADGGAFLIAALDRAVTRADLLIEEPENVDAFVCSYLRQPYFMNATAGTRLADLPYESQWLALRHTDGHYTVYFSIAEPPVRTSFYGAEDGLHAIALTGDSQAAAASFPVAFRAEGEDLYALVHTAAAAMASRFGGCSLREDKTPPAFMKQFGWCTWDSFYEKVCAEDVARGLESFRAGGFVPRLLILDDGWQSTDENELARGEWKLSSFAPNQKFGGDLTETVRLAKTEYGVAHFFVWHAVLGYWGGVSLSSPEMAAYLPHPSAAVHTDEIKAVNPERWATEHFPFGLIAKSAFSPFYEGYHAALAAQGVDGVKVDVQASLTGHGEGNGGRVSLVRAMREGLEGSVCAHFGGEMINCMSTANDILYHTKHTNMMRSSDDFFPNDPTSHAKHVYTNAVNSIYMGEFTLCDWDMFQTLHPYGAYHAASRAISGSPVYVSDRVDEHDFSVIRALTGDEGELLLPLDIAKPTLDCLFVSPESGTAPLKIYNRNRFGSVLGIFAKDTETPVLAEFGAADIPACTGKLAAYAYRSGKAYLTNREERSTLAVSSGDFEIVTYAPVRDGLAVIGLLDKYNAGGAVAAVHTADAAAEITLSASGKLVLYTERPVRLVTDAEGCPLAHETRDGFLFVKAPRGRITLLYA